MAEALPIKRVASGAAAGFAAWLVMLCAAGSPASAAAPVEAPLAPAVGGLWGAWTAPGDASSVAAFESTTHRRLDIVHQYHAFDDAWPTSTEYSWAAGGRIIFGNVSARESNGSVLTWTAVANGSQDSVIDALAARLKAFGRALFLSFDEEPENRYHANPSVYTIASFGDAYRHLYARFSADGVRNVVWVWNVTGDPGDESLYTGGLYPGDGYVSWIAWDPYNWNTCVHPYGWRTFDQIVAPFYNWVAGGGLSAASAGKPYMLAEYGSVEGATGAKGQWFLGEAATITSRPRLKAVVYFNENKDCNWPITTSSSSVSGFTSAGLSCYFNRAVPAAPGSVSASAGNASVVVSWSASSSVCPLTGYVVYMSPGGREVSVSATSTSTTLTGLANGTTYQFRVLATSMNGASAWSASTAPVIPLGAAQSSPTHAASPSASPRASAGPSAPASPQPARSPQPAPSAGVQVTPVAARATDSLTSWLEGHFVALPLALGALLVFGLGTQLALRRRRRG